MKLDGLNAVITGAGSGIGKACALMLAKAGARVALIGRNPDELYSAIDEMMGGDLRHFAIKADVGNETEMIAAYRSVGLHWDKLDIVVASSGINGAWAPLDQLGVEEWDQTMDVNLRGTFLTVKLALPLLRRQGGAVVVISSPGGARVFSNSGATACSCSKAAQVAFTKLAALELASDRIRVNVVCPGAIVKTGINHSIKRRDPEDLPEANDPWTGGDSGMAEQVAELIAFLASGSAAHITGAEVFIEGGESLRRG